MCIIWGLVSVFSWTTWNLSHLNIQFISHCFANFPSSFWILNVSSMCSPVFILFRRLNSSTNLMSLFPIPFSRPLKKHLSSPGTKGDPFKTSLVIYPRLTLSLGMVSCSVHWLLLAQSNKAAKSTQRKYFVFCFTKIMQKNGWCCLEFESLLYVENYIFVCVVNSAMWLFINTVIRQIVGHPCFVTENSLFVFKSSLYVYSLSFVFE